MSDLEYLHKALDRFSLKYVFDDYIAWMKQGSLHDFLAYNAQRLGIRESDSLADDALESLEQVRQVFFDSEDSA